MPEAKSALQLPVFQEADTDSVSSWHSGWTAGTGVEYALTQNWIAGVEYDFSDLGQKTTTGVNSPSGNVSQI